MSQLLERFKRKKKQYKVEVFVLNDQGMPIRKFEVLAYGRSKSGAKQTAVGALKLKAGRTWRVVDKL